MELKCKICGNQFEFTKEEEGFYKDRNLNYPPKRCPNCRAKKKIKEDEVIKLRAKIAELEDTIKSLTPKGK